MQEEEGTIYTFLTTSRKDYNFDRDILNFLPSFLPSFLPFAVWETRQAHLFNFEGLRLGPGFDYAQKRKQG